MGALTVLFCPTPPTRVAIVGPNGAGKSTLLKLMVGTLEPLDGMVKRHNHLRIGQYHQHLTELLDPDLSPLEYMVRGRVCISGVHTCINPWVQQRLDHQHLTELGLLPLENNVFSGARGCSQQPDGVPLQDVR